MVMIFTMYFLSVSSLMAGQQLTPSCSLMGWPMVKPSSKGEINVGSDNAIASSYPHIIMEKAEKSNTFVVVIPRKTWYNVTQY